MSALRFPSVPRPRSAGDGVLAIGLMAAALAGGIIVGLTANQGSRTVIEVVGGLALVPLMGWLFTSARYERTCTVVLIYICCIDGVLKLSSGDTVVSLGRDAVVWAVAAGAAVRMILTRTRVRLPPYGGFVAAWVAIVILQIPNPNGISLSHSVISIRPDIEFVPLFFLGHACVRSPARLRGFLFLILGCAAANGLASLVQTGLSPNDVASWGPGYRTLEFGSTYQVGTAFVGASGHLSVRPMALGGFEGFGGTIGIFGVAAGVALLTQRDLRFAVRVAVVPALICAAIGVLTSQARTDLLGSIIAMFAFGLLTANSRRSLRTMVGLAVIVLMGYALYGVVVPQRANRYAGTKNSIGVTHLSSTLSSTLALHGTLTYVPKYIVTYPLGAGLGRAGSALGSGISGVSSQNAGLNAESEFTYLLIETGIPGLLVMLGLYFTLLRTSFRLKRIQRDDIQRPLMALSACICFLAVDWEFGAVSGSSPQAPFFWTVAGVLSYWAGEARAGRVAMRTSLSGHLTV